MTGLKHTDKKIKNGNLLLCCFPVQTLHFIAAAGRADRARISVELYKMYHSCGQGVKVVRIQRASEGTMQTSVTRIDHFLVSL